MYSQEEASIIWAAGFLEGEGSFIVNKTGRIRVVATSTDLDVLTKLQKVFGGIIYSVAKRQNHWKQSWVWNAGGNKTTIPIMQKVLPHMGKRRTEAITKCLESFNTKQATRLQKKNDLNQRNTKIRCLRKETNATHKELATLFGLSRESISKILYSES